MKQIIRLTESDLHKIVKESIGKILKEIEGGCWDKEELWNIHHPEFDNGENDDEDEGKEDYLGNTI
jgi:hypothetical protein